MLVGYYIRWKGLVFYAFTRLSSALRFVVREVGESVVWQLDESVHIA
jgi:hypothetical protein